MICKGSHQSIKLKLTTSNFLNSLKCWAVTKSGVVNWSNCSIIVSILFPIQWAFSSLPCAAMYFLDKWGKSPHLKINSVKTFPFHTTQLQSYISFIFGNDSLDPLEVHTADLYNLCSLAYLLLSCEMCYFLWPLISGWRAESCFSPSWSHTFLETFPVMGKNRSEQQWKNDVE